mmetsp:Transcript_16389/g.42592  ORF Transcript_16389/g.42592 Transcript_16389/m.42592 type:complete len:269 (-) Transcript_16389:481-1287(-)|eukprot:jgi/Tetstr1/424636/TSEL_015158.t1
MVRSLTAPAGLPHALLCLLLVVPRRAAGTEVNATRFYDQYHARRGAQTTGAPVAWDRVRELYPPGEYRTVLDAGAGNCALMRLLLEEGDREEVMGSELSGGAIRRYCRGGGIPTGAVKQAPMHSLPFEDGTFDLVISMEVLEHIPEEQAVASLRELIRVSKDGELLLTISLRRAWQDPDPPEEATIHVNVKPRAWWHSLLEFQGCTLREDVLLKGQRRVKHRSTALSLQRKFSGRPLHAPVQDGEFQPWFFPCKCRKQHGEQPAGDLP